MSATTYRVLRTLAILLFNTFWVYCVFAFVSMQPDFTEWSSWWRFAFLISVWGVYGGLIAKSR